jgi:hypothetical protein
MELSLHSSISLHDVTLSIAEGQVLTSISSLGSGPCHRSGRWSPAPRVRSQVVDKVALGQVSSECFGFPCQFSFHRLLHTHVPSEGCTIGNSGRRTKWTQSHPSLRNLKTNRETTVPKITLNNVTSSADSLSMCCVMYSTHSF